MTRSEPSVLEAFRADVQAMSMVRVIALLTVPAVIAFEWGFGNDFANVFAISTAYESSTGIFAVARAMLAGFVVPFVMQVVGGAIASVGYGALTGTALALRARIARRSKSVAGLAYSRLRFRDQWWVSVALGTTAAVLLEQGRPLPQHSDDESGSVRAVVLISASFMAVTTSLVAGVTATLLEFSRRFEALQPIVDDLIAVLTNPFAWILLFIVIGAGRLLMSRRGGSE